MTLLKALQSGRGYRFAGRQTSRSRVARKTQSLMMQRIIVQVLRGGAPIATYRFLNPPRQAAGLEQALEKLGHRGVLQDDSDTYFGDDLLQSGAYTLKVSEAAAGKSFSRPSCLVWVACA